METARDDGRDAPLVVVPARVAVIVAKFVHSVAAQVLVVGGRRTQRRPPMSPTGHGEAPLGWQRREMARRKVDGRCGVGRWTSGRSSGQRRKSSTPTEARKIDEVVLCRTYTSSRVTPKGQ